MPAEKYSHHWSVKRNDSSSHRSSTGAFGAVSPFMTGVVLNHDNDDSAMMDRRIAHNALERQRREHLNTKFQELALALPSLHAIRRPSKSLIVTKSLEFVSSCANREKDFQKQIAELCEENKRLRKQVASAGHRQTSPLRTGISSPTAISDQTTLVPETPVPKNEQKTSALLPEATKSNEQNKSAESAGSEQRDGSEQGSQPGSRRASMLSADNAQTESPLTKHTSDPTAKVQPALATTTGTSTMSEVVIKAKETKAVMSSPTPMRTMATLSPALLTKSSVESLPVVSHKPIPLHLTPTSMAQPIFTPPTLMTPEDMRGVSYPHHSHHPHRVQYMPPSTFNTCPTEYHATSAMAAPPLGGVSQLSHDATCFYCTSPPPVRFGYYSQPYDPVPYPPPPYSYAISNTMFPSYYMFQPQDNGYASRYTYESKTGSLSR